ncbi:hypothetical protein EV180_005655, partial [Coemansia sp. RSA 518]
MPVHTDIVDADRERTDPRLWSVDQVVAWLSEVSLDQTTIDIFAERHINGAALVKRLTLSVLCSDLGIPADIALGIMPRIRALCQRWAIVPVELDDNTLDTLTAPHFEMFGAGDGSLSDSSSEDDSTAQLIRRMANEAPGRVVARRLSLFSTAFLGSCSNSDSESESGTDMDCRMSENESDSVLERVADIQLETADSDSETMSLSVKSTSTNLLLEVLTHELPALDPGVVSSPLTSARLPDKLDQMRIDVVPSSPAQTPDELPLLAQSSVAPELLPPSTDTAHVTLDSGDDCDVEHIEASMILSDPDPVTNNANPEHSLSATDMDTDDRDLEPATVTPKPKRRIAPMLITTELSNNLTGNIIDQCGEEDDLLGPPAPVQSSRRTRDLLRSEFPCSALLFEPRAHRIRHSGSNMTGFPTVDFMETAGDTFWFCRYRSCRMTSENIEQTKDGKWVALWNRMLYVQALQRHLVCDDSLLTETDNSEDTVLPLYGESDGEGELSDGLMREIAKEQRDVVARKEKAAETESRRVTMVTTVIREMVEQYALEWHNRIQPKFEENAFHIWGKYIAIRDVLLQRLADLRDRRLLKAQQSVISSGVTTRNQAKSLCGGLRATVEDIAQLSWVLNLLAQPRPARPPPVSPTIQQVSQPNDVPVDAELEV